MKQLNVSTSITKLIRNKTVYKFGKQASLGLFKGIQDNEKSTMNPQPFKMLMGSDKYFKISDVNICPR